MRNLARHRHHPVGRVQVRKVPRHPRRTLHSVIFPVSEPAAACPPRRICRCRICIREGYVLPSCVDDLPYPGRSTQMSLIPSIDLAQRDRSCNVLHMDGNRPLLAPLLSSPSSLATWMPSSLHSTAVTSATVPWVCHVTILTVTNRSRLQLGGNILAGTLNGETDHAVAHTRISDKTTLISPRVPR